MDSGASKESFCATREGEKGGRASEVPRDCHDPTCWDEAVDKNGLVEGTE